MEDDRSVAAPGRLMALDVGNVRIGIALSDPLGYTVHPLLTLQRKGPRADVKSIVRLARKHGVSEIVVGNPLHMSGEVSAQAMKSQAFAQLIRDACELPVWLCDERLTTAEAHRYLTASGRAFAGRKDVIDQVAAMLILESFLAERTYQAARARRWEPGSL